MAEKNETARRNFMSEKENADVDKAMKAMTKGDSEGLYTESYYNTDASDKERKGYDAKAHKLLYAMYAQDKSEGKFENIDFARYIGVINNAWFDEKTTYAREGEADFYHEAGMMLEETYGGDVDQFKLSVRNFSAAPKDRSRANISIKAPGAESY